MIDTKRMRELSEFIGLMKPDFLTPSDATLINEAADEIDSLRAQLAEARANAVPWRDGPAKGGEMRCDDSRYIIVRLTQFGKQYVVVGTVISRDVFWSLNKTEYPNRIIKDWCRFADLIPADPAKPEGGGK